MADLGKKVYQIYQTKAKEYLTGGFRSTWWYLANKALSDWDLLERAAVERKDVLNIGSAEPIDEMIFARLVKSWTALDNNKETQETAKKIVENELSPNLAKKIRFVTADAAALPFRDETFDVVVSFSTIEHLPSKEKRQKMLEEIYRVLKPGGFAAITTSNKWNIIYYFWSKSQQKKNQTDFGYEHLYSPPEFRKSLFKASLKPIYFTSVWQPIIAGGGLLKGFLRRLLLPLKYFGFRMGYLCKK